MISGAGPRDVRPLVPPQAACRPCVRLNRNSTDMNATSSLRPASSNRFSYLGYHLKTGHTLSVQNRPTGLAEDVIVLPCFSVRLQGADFVVEAVLDF
jgi:hypothetical protein